MTVPENARGYAYKAFTVTWDRQLAYPAMAAAKKYGYYPLRPDYINHGLRLFDRMWAMATHDNESLRRIVTSIVKDMGQSIRTDVLGHFKYTGAAGEPQWISTKHDVMLDEPLNDETTTTYADMLDDVEDGYAKVDDDDVMFDRLTLIAHHLSPQDMTILEAYIDGASFIDACNDAGVNVGAFTKRIRYQCESLKKVEAFA